MEPLFKFSTGSGEKTESDRRLIPCLPIDGMLNAIAADGIQFFSVAQAVKRSGRSERSLRDDWRATFGDFFPDDTQPHDTQPAAAANQSAAEDLSDVNRDPQSEPSVPVAAATVAGRLDQIRFATLRQSMYGHLSDDQFEEFLAKCRAIELSPWWKLVYPKVVYDAEAKRKTVELIVGIHGLRMIADRTGQYAGSDEAAFEYEPDGSLKSACVTVYKLVDGQRFAFSQRAHREEYELLEGDGSDYRANMPRHWLEKCSEALSLRKAFPTRMAGCYTPEEMAQVDQRRRRVETLADTQLPADEAQLKPRNATSPITFSAGPASWSAFQEELKRRGIDPDRAGEVIRHYNGVFPALAQSPSASKIFWKKILDDIDVKPEAWAA